MALLNRADLGAVVLVALAGAGCVRDPVAVRPTETRVALVGLVLAGADSISIALARVEPEQGPAPEAGAVLRVSTPNGSTTLSERPGTACGLSAAFTCHRGAIGPLAPGDRVLLEGTLASGRRIDGETVIPAPPVLTFEDGSPVPDTLRLTDSLRSPLLLAASPAGRVGVVAGELAGTVEVAGESHSCTFANVFDPFIAFDRFAFSLGPPIPECSGVDPTVEWDRATVAIDLVAFDSSYSAYLDSFDGEPVFVTESQWGIEGVIGAFGSAARRRVVLVVERD